MATQKAPSSQSSEASASQPAAAATATDAPAASTDQEARAGGGRRIGRFNLVTALLLIVALLAACGVGFAAGRVTATGQSGTGTSTGANDRPAGMHDMRPYASGSPGYGHDLPLRGRPAR